MKRHGTILSAVLGVLRLGGGTDHLPELKLLGELATQDSEIAHQLVAGGNHGILGGDLTVGLDTEQETVLEGVGDLAVLDCVRGRKGVVHTL